MACYHPLTALKSNKPKANGKYEIIVLKKDKDGKYSANSADSTGNSVPIQLPCGQCIGCRLERSRQWAVRIINEAQQYEDNSFITLTYDNDHLPHDGSVNVRHFQLFMKRLRKSLKGKKVRFFHCGEYGEKLGRPHYHAILFNHKFTDGDLISDRQGVKLFNSPKLAKIWGKGMVSTGDVTFESAAYVARYIMKKQTGENAFDHYTEYDKFTGEVTSHKSPEYTTMSRRPGIGRAWYEKFKKDVYPYDFQIINGKKVRPPRYYDSLYELENPEGYEAIKEKRHQTGLTLEKDNTLERLAVKEKITQKRVEQLVRPLT